MKQNIVIKAGLIIFLLFVNIQVFSQNRWLDAIGEIHPAFPKTHLLESAESYFEVEETAKPGDEVIGRVNLANNSFEKAEFEITGGSGVDLFEIEKFINSKGKHFGILKVKQLPLNRNEYTVKVTALFENGENDNQEYRIKKVRTTLAEKFHNYIFSRLSSEKRLFFPVKDSKLAEYLLKFNSDGTFSDLNYGMSKDGWKGLNEGAERINGMGIAYLDKNSSFYKDESLKQKIYKGILLNANEFAKYRTQWYDSHLWRNTDYIAGIGLNFFSLLQDEMNSSDIKVARKAVKVYDAILDNLDNLFAERMDERPAIGNANRNHRMRSLAVRAAITYDYNRTITDWDLWYDKVDPRIPGFYPNGAINDFVELIETSFVVADTYNNKNGFFPDGTICHHPASGIQFTADGYGWPWLTEWSIPMMNLFRNTRFQLQNTSYNTITERILDAYRPLTFSGYLDMSVGGLVPDRKKWGKRLLSAVKGLIDGKSTTTVIEKENELLTFKANLEKERYSDPLSISKAFWNIDYLIQRRPDYFASVKMISKRSRGLERGIKKRSYYYLGDGALFIRVNPDDYNNIQNYYNWHAIPGTTAEQRNDDLPPSATSPYLGASGTNTFAGVVSNSSIGFGAFKYERNHENKEVLYSTVNANKGYFFFENKIVALGNNVNRVGSGDGADILTTLNQLEWKGDISYGKVGDTYETISFSQGNAIKHLKANQKPYWVYHDKVGYIIIPEKKKTAIELVAESRKPRWTKKTAKKGIFQLSINHGSSVTDDSYRYIVLPATTIDKVKSFAQSIDNGHINVIKNKKSQMAVYNPKKSVLQAAFYEKGILDFETVDGEKIQLKVDKPALVMLKDNGETLEFSVTDPLHSTKNPTINVIVNLKLKGEVYDQAKGVTNIAFSHSSEELYAGQPVIRVFEKEKISKSDSSSTRKR